MVTQLTPPDNADGWNKIGKDCLPGLFGIEVLSFTSDELKARMKVTKQLCAPNGFLHAASVIALADTACGYATVNNLPAGAEGFTTIELKTNFIGTALKGDVNCVARQVHKGRSTQIWDAEVSSEETGKKIAIFRCTQMILWPKSPKK
jgi:1,4-dihydroxy-2-naphthoyl-CoA hydrolase